MLSRKKILFLEQYSNLSGGPRVMLGIISGLDRRDYDLTVVLAGEGDLSRKLDEQGIEHLTLAMGNYSIGYKTIFDIFNYLARIPSLTFTLAGIIKKRKIDLVYANGARTFVWATLACSCAAVPIVWHVHSIFAGGLIKRLCLFFGNFRQVKKIITVSYAARYPLEALADKIETIHNGIDTNIFYPDQNKRNLRSQFGLKDDDLVIASIGLILGWKNQEDLIRAASLVFKSSDLGAKFLIIGSPLYSCRRSIKYEQRLKQMVRALGLEDKVIFTGPRDDIPDIMRLLDILVLTSKEPDPCPLVVLEAMSSSLAVIATDFGGPKEIIEQGVDGFLYQAGDAEDLAAKILSLAKDSQKRKLIGQNARSKIKNKFNKPQYVQRIKEIIDGCIE